LKKGEIEGGAGTKVEQGSTAVNYSPEFKKKIKLKFV
jgi:hypothetical protein